MTNPYRAFDVTLARRERLSESFIRLSLHGADLSACSPTLLDQRVKLVLGEPHQLDLLIGQDWYEAWSAAEDKPVLRTYTLSAVRPDAGEVDVDVVLHGSPGDGAGPASAFAQDAEPGARLLLVAADRSEAGHDIAGVAYHPGQAARVVLVADATALPAVANILAARRDDVRYEALIQVPHESDVRELAADRVTWRISARGESVLDVQPFAGGPTESAAADEDLLWDEAEGTSGGTYLWAAGEAGMIRLVRAAAKRAGFDRSSSSFMGYWREGRASD